MILILAVIAGAVLFYLGLKPHQEFSRYAMMDGNVDGFGVLRMNPDDQGVSEFTNYLFNRMKKSKKESADAGQAKTLSILLKLSKNFLTQFLQPESMIYANYNPATADESVVMSIPLKNRVAWLAMKQYVHSNIAKEPVTTEGPAELYPLTSAASGSTGTLLSLHPNDIVISDNQALLLKSLGYAADPQHGGTPSPDLQKFIDELGLDEPVPGEDLAVALINEESRITNLIHVFEEFIGISGLSERVAEALAAQKLTFADISGIKLTADLASADQLNGEMTLYCASPDRATRLAKVFETALPHVTGADNGSLFKLKGTAVGRGVTVVVNLELSGLKAWVNSILPVTETPAPADPAVAPAVTVTTSATPAPQ
jgi:hypothetical protein